MKKQRIKKQNIFVAALLVCAALSAAQVYALPDDPVAPLIHIGAGDQVTEELEITGASSSSMLNANIPGRNVVLDGIDLMSDGVTEVTSATDSNASIMTTLGTGWLQGRNFVGARYSNFEFGNTALGDPVYTGPALVGTLTAPLRATSSFAVWTSALNSGTGILTADLQKINVLGGLLTTSLNNTATTGSAQVCVDAAGTLILCG